MKLSTAINKAGNVYASITTHGYTIPVQISKSKAKEAMSQWLSTEDWEDNGHFCDEESYGIAYFDDETGELHLGN
tara:strand:- start:34 stop:258 length:225 start_codon:yes stop_codon:yes gene_type:complete